MSLVFASIVPHPPMLVPNIGKEHTNKLASTLKAYKELEQELYLSKPQTIIVIAPHEGLFADSFVVNAHTEFNTDFEQFGDFETKQTWTGAPDIAANIQHMANENRTRVTLVSNEKISHGVSVPLYFMANHLKGISILPIGYSGLNHKEHLNFGVLLKELIMDSHKRIAIIASGDLSHNLEKNSQKNPKEGSFDAEIIKLLETKNTSGLLNIDPKLMEKTEECGYQSILILLGILQNMDCQFKNLAYEHPFGIGYLTGEFKFD